ncbi:hypothetical protein [Hyella patelloides]|nr:hypothetical protein [Hyella patelloides]
MYESFNNKQTIEITRSGKKILLKEQEFNIWLLICNGEPQILLEPQEASLFLKKLNRQHSPKLVSSSCK